MRKFIREVIILQLPYTTHGVHVLLPVNMEKGTVYDKYSEYSLYVELSLQIFL